MGQDRARRTRDTSSPSSSAASSSRRRTCGRRRSGGSRRRTSTPRRCPSDSLRFTGWAPEAIEAAFPDLDPTPSYEIEATYLCERDVRSRPGDDLARASSSIRRPSSPGQRPPSSGSWCRRAAYADGTLEVAVERIAGPDVVMSELRLFSSEPPPPAITVVGDSRGGLIGTVGAPDWRGRCRGPGAASTVDAGAFERHDRRGRACSGSRCTTACRSAGTAR